METTAQRCTRLVGALEELAECEAASVAAQDLPGVADAQNRSAPIVAYLAAHAADVTAPRLRDRIERLLRRRAQAAAALGDLARACAEALQALEDRRARVARLVPVYGRPPAAKSRLRAVG